MLQPTCARLDEMTNGHKLDNHVTTDNFSQLFSDQLTVATPTITDLAAWRQAEEGSRLLLPPIQRSVVWSNEQVINYRDSLLRGYPAGMMMVHRAQRGRATQAARAATRAG